MDQLVSSLMADIKSGTNTGCRRCAESSYGVRGGLEFPVLENRLIDQFVNQVLQMWHLRQHSYDWGSLDRDTTANSAASRPQLIEGVHFKGVHFFVLSVDFDSSQKVA